METLLVVGLGNPGDEYAATRHNVGFMVADELCRRSRGRWKIRGGDSALAQIRIGQTGILLLKPLTYMNNSGTAVGETLSLFGLSPGSLLVVVDDFALPLGKLRLRMRGSDGGHNGLTSIMYELNSDQFARLRCGIGRENMPAKEQRAEFVLSPFDEQETADVRGMVARAADAVAEITNSGLNITMNKFNT